MLLSRSYLLSHATNLSDLFPSHASLPESPRELSLELSRLGTEHGLGPGVSR
jgi:hypothetical protein